MGRLIVNIPVRDVQADEIWSFSGKKEKMRTSDDDPNLGDAQYNTPLRIGCRPLLVE
jgi:hypothetical protein